jgi:guanylate kinase
MDKKAQETQILVTVTGPSASGKTELVKALEANHPFSRLISITTRPPRTGEVDGVDYDFTNDTMFDWLEERGHLLQTVVFGGYRYGTTIGEYRRVLETGKTPIVVVEPKGVEHFKGFAWSQSFKNTHIQIYTVFISAHYDVLKTRFMHRQSSSDPSALLLRLGSIKDELALWGNRHEYDMKIVNNGDEKSDILWFATEVSNNVANLREPEQPEQQPERPTQTSDQQPANNN